MDNAKTSCFKFPINECEGACIQQESSESYNLKIQELIAKSSFENQNLIIIDKGRALNEHSVILIENGVFKGFGYYDLNFQITNKKILESIITPMESNRDTQHIIQSYLRKNKQVKIVKLTD